MLHTALFFFSKISLFNTYAVCYKKQSIAYMIIKGGLYFAVSFPPSSAASEASDGAMTKAHSGRDPERKQGFYLV